VSKCEHLRARRVLGSVKWCRDCGALRVGETRARWVAPGRRPGSVMRKRSAPRAQLFLVGVDDSPCPDCEGGRVLGYVCGFCEGTGLVSAEVAKALKFSRGET